jgi:hypothetical protein
MKDVLAVALTVTNVFETLGIPYFPGETAAQRHR